MLDADGVLDLAEQRAEVLRLCGDWRHTVQHVFINDMPAAQYGKRFKCHAPAMIEPVEDDVAGAAQLGSVVADARGLAAGRHPGSGGDRLIDVASDDVALGRGGHRSDVVPVPIVVLALT